MRSAFVPVIPPALKDPEYKKRAALPIHPAQEWEAREVLPALTYTSSGVAVGFLTHDYTDYSPPGALTAVPVRPFLSSYLTLCICIPFARRCTDYGFYCILT